MKQLNIVKMRKDYCRSRDSPFFYGKIVGKSKKKGECWNYGQNVYEQNYSIKTN